MWASWHACQQGGSQDAIALVGCQAVLRGSMAVAAAGHQSCCLRLQERPALGRAEGRWRFGVVTKW